MKRFCLVIVVILLFNTLPSVKPVSALDNAFDYAKIVTDDCAFYSDASLKIVKFYLTKSYAVKVVSVGGEASRVVYMDGNYAYPSAEGYVKNVCLEFLDATPDVLYPDVNLFCTSDEVLFTDSGLSQPKAVIPKGSSAKFYGELSINGYDYVYTYVNGYVGYMRKDGFSPFVVPVFEEIVIPPIVDEPISETKTEQNSNGNFDDFSVTEIIIVIAVVVVGLLLIFFILKSNGGNNGSKNDFEDD